MVWIKIHTTKRGIKSAFGTLNTAQSKVLQATKAVYKQKVIDTFEIQAKTNIGIQKG